MQERFTSVYHLLTKELKQNSIVKMVKNAKKVLTFLTF